MDTLSRIRNTTVLVIGDLMLDRYWWGDVNRISPEAPVPVIKLKRSSLAAGGAANVAVNVAGLGARALLVGVLGNDPEAALFREVLREAHVMTGHLVESRDRPTTVKTRVIAHSQQVTRVDQEVDSPIDAETERCVLERVDAQLDRVSAVVISDYAKGLLTDSLVDRIIKDSKDAGKPVLIDPKGRDYTKYNGATLITPNLKEAAQACNLDENTADVLETAGQRLLDEIDVESLLITQGEHGMTLFRGGSSSRYFPAVARKVYDVTGAGDTVIATLAAAMGSGADIETATDLANLAAGIVVEQVGTTSISSSSLEDALESRRAGHKSLSA